MSTVTSMTALPALATLIAVLLPAFEKADFDVCHEQTLRVISGQRQKTAVIDGAEGAEGEGAENAEQRPARRTEGTHVGSS